MPELIYINESFPLHHCGVRGQVSCFSETRNLSPCFSPVFLFMEVLKMKYNFDQRIDVKKQMRIAPKPSVVGANCLVQYCAFK